jgi:hypothetical protein
MHVPAYDWMFLGVGGLLFIAVGWRMSRPHDAYTREQRKP